MKPIIKNISPFRQAFQWDVVRRALIMAAIVGTVLVNINHGMCIYSGKFGITCAWQSALTYMVPYTVSTISSVLAMAQFSRRELTAVNDSV